jgi:ABC-type lipoprotein export system ATPase subunit
MIVEIESLEVVLNTGKDSVKILDIPQWRVEEAERVAIFGPSGSGKSTLLYTLA